MYVYIIIDWWKNPGPSYEKNYWKILISNVNPKNKQSQMYKAFLYYYEELLYIWKTKYV